MAPSLFGLQAPILVALGTCVGYAALIAFVMRRRGWDSWPLRTLLLFLMLSILWSIGFSLTLWVGLRTEVPDFGLRLAYAMLMFLAPAAVVLTLMFLERPGVKWV